MNNRGEDPLSLKRPCPKREARIRMVKCYKLLCLASLLLLIYLLSVNEVTDSNTIVKSLVCVAIMAVSATMVEKLRYRKIDELYP